MSLIFILPSTKYLQAIPILTSFKNCMKVLVVRILKNLQITCHFELLDVYGLIILFMLMLVRSVNE